MTWRAFPVRFPTLADAPTPTHINGLTTRLRVTGTPVAGRNALHRPSARAALDPGARKALSTTEQAQHVARGIGTSCTTRPCALGSQVVQATLRGLFGGKRPSDRPGSTTRWPGGRGECSSRAVRAFFLTGASASAKAPMYTIQRSDGRALSTSRPGGRAAVQHGASGNLLFVRYPACRHSPACRPRRHAGSVSRRIPVPRRTAAPPIGHWGHGGSGLRVAATTRSTSEADLLRQALQLRLYGGASPIQQQVLRPGVVARVGQQQDKHKNAAWVL